MKKILILIAFITAFTAGKAQYDNPVTLVSANGYAADTVSNTATKYLVFGTAVLGDITYSMLKGVLHNASIAVTVTKISGTVAGGVRLESSLDGVNWFSTFDGGSFISFDPTDVASQTYRFSPSRWNDLYIRVKYTGSGTMSARVEAKLFARKAVH